MIIISIGYAAKIIIGIIILAGIGYLFYNLTKTKNNQNKNLPQVEGDSKDEIEKIILDYLDSYKLDNKKYELANFYSRQLHIKELQADYYRKVERKTIGGFNFSFQENIFCTSVLKDKLKHEIGEFKDEYSPNQILSFLLDLSQIQGRVEALQEINNNHVIVDSDIQRFNEYEKDNLNRIESLIADFKNMPN